MRLQLGRIFAIATVLAASVVLYGCPPKYPLCENDDHCAEKSEVCINKQCQECGEDSHCAAKYTDEERECVGGRCEIKPECRLDGDCTTVGDGLVCRGNTCVPECSADEDCPAGFTCTDQKCVGECEQDVDCGPGRTCNAGVCEDEVRGDNVSSACRPTESGDVVALSTVSFDFNEYDLTSLARNSLEQNAECMQQAPSVSITIEGHCDERGTQEYNLALGEKRANTVKSYLKNLGVETSRMNTRSKGENEPVCRASNESCWSDNRRVQFIQSR